MHDAANARADAAFNNLNTGFSADWNLAAYGSYSQGGSAFARIGAGPGSFASVGGSWAYLGTRTQMHNGQYGNWYEVWKDYTTNGREDGSDFVGMRFKPLGEQQQTQGSGKGSGGFDWFFGAEEAATLGWRNFAIEVKNVGGVDYKRDARDWRISSSTKCGGSRPKSPNRATIDRTSVSFGYGATIQKNKDIVNGIADFTESYSVGWEALGIQVNFDSKQNVTDIRFGIDTGVSIAIFGNV